MRSIARDAAVLTETRVSVGVAGDAGPARDASAPNDGAPTDASVAIDAGVGSSSHEARVLCRATFPFTANGGFFRAEDSNGRYVATDADDNIAIVGAVATGAVDFGGGPISAAIGDWTLFVVKFDSACRFLWSRSFGAPGARVEGSPIVIDREGSILVAGTFWGAVDFGDGRKVSLAATTNGFFVKLGADGNTQFSVVLPSADLSLAYDIAADSANNIIVSGSAGLDTDFGGGVTIGSGPPAFLAKYSTTGSLVWVRRLPSGIDEAYVRALSTGDLMLVGFVHTLDWDDGSATIDGPGVSTFYSQLDSRGVHRWTTSSPSDASWGWDFVIDPLDRVVTSFGTVPSGNPPAKQRAVEAIDIDGKLTSIASWDSTNDESQGLRIVLDSQRNLIELGQFTSPLALGEQRLDPIGSNDVYVAKRDPSGAISWAAHEAAASLENSALGLACDTNDNAIALWDAYDSSARQPNALTLVKFAP